MHSQSSLPKMLRQALGGVCKIRIIGPRLFDEPELMELGAPRDQRGYKRCPDAAPNIAHKIDDPSNGIVLFRRNSNIGDQRDCHKKESQPYDLSDTQPSGSTEADLQVNPLGRVVHSNGHCKPAEGNEAPSLNF